MGDSRPQLFNTLTRRVEPFEPLFPDARDAAGRPAIGMYCCGPTVYDFGHIGNFRTFVFADLVRRYLEFRGFGVNHVMNITDVEDKIIRRVRESGKTLREFTATYTEAFLDDLAMLNCLRPHHLPRATEFMPQIIALIQKLEQRGIAYRAADGSVYFSIEKYRGCGCRYGQLVNLNFDAMRVGERVANDEYDKESLADFALWKARVPDDGDVFWESPWGQGRPGWHIECSAMSMAILGPSFDLHLGGEDLAFPHHEDEIAQSEGAGLQTPGRPFVKHWLHGAHLLVEGKKMSKSLGNYFTVRDLIAKGYTGREVRTLLLSAHFRETFNFTLAGLDGARAQLARIDECLAKLRELVAQAPSPESVVQAPSPELVADFTAAMDDDLNVSKAWGVVFDWVRDTNRALAEGQLSPAQAAAALAEWTRIDSVFGLGAKASDEAPVDILALANERVAAKKAKDFARADVIRNELKAKGWVVEDTAKGPKLKRT
jgi:cysteinyl-tRNA synthetase